MFLSHKPSESCRCLATAEGWQALRVVWLSRLIKYSKLLKAIKLLFFIEIFLG